MKLLSFINESLNKAAPIITKYVGTMVCAVVFAVIGVMGIVGALTGNTGMVLIVGSISGYFLQLVLLPIIMVAGKLQSDKTIHHIKKIHKHLGIKED